MRTVNGVTIDPEGPLAEYYTNASPVIAGVPLPDLSRAIYVGTSGDLTVIMAGDATNTPITFPSVTAGTILKLAISQVVSGSAGSIVAMY